MTFDEKFSRAYRASVEAAPKPTDLADRISKATKAQTRPDATSNRKQAPFWQPATLIGVCAAASLALIAALPAILPALEDALSPAAETFHEEQPEPTPPEEEDTSARPNGDQLLPGLSVRAFALGNEEGDVPEWAKGMSHSWGEPYIEGAESPIALFYPGGASGSGSMTMWPEEDGSVTKGYFIGYTFTLEGSNIARVQIRTSEGELYLQSIDKAVCGNRKVDLTDLDPRQRGKRAGYQDCDALGSCYWMDKDDEGHWRMRQDAFRMKRMGQIIDLSKNDDERVGTREIQFGLLSMATTSAEGKPVNWMSDNHFADTLEMPDFIFDGTQLTITATFDDGTCETQVIDLHRDWVLANEDGTEPAQPIQLYENVFNKKDTTCIDLAYGTLASSTNEPFPYADEMANQYADAVMPPMPAWSQPYSTD